MTARSGRLDLRQDLWKIVGVLGVLLLLNVGFYALMNLPRLRALGSMERRRDDVRRALRTATQRSAAMRDLVRRYDEDIVRLDDFYANRLGTQAERMTTVQKQIRTIAGEFKIDPESIDYNPAPVEGTDLTEFQITIPMVGGYQNLRQFVSRIESSEQLLIFDSIELAGSREGGLMLSLTIKISTFFRSPDRDLGRRPPPAPGA